MAAGIPVQPVGAPRRRGGRLPLLAILLGALAAGAAPSATLVRYSFDDGAFDTGPDTFAVFQKARGRVRLTGAFRYSGYRSVEIRDSAGDRAFPELQGYFPLRRSGTIYVHFALMTADANEQLNIPLAGPEWFTLAKDGIAFWLQTRGGSLFHHSDSMPKRLLPLSPLTWYLVDVAYDIDGGTYDLEIRQENLVAPLVSLNKQLNAFNEAGSAVDKFSFIDDHGHDTSNVVYYVDDVLVTLDQPIDLAPLVAPGRRKLFVDMFHDAVRALHGRPGCLPSTELSDFGLTPSLVQEIKEAGLLPALETLLAGARLPAVVPAGAPAGPARLPGAVRTWREGCEALRGGDAAAALARFSSAAAENRDAGLFELSEVLALAALHRREEADGRLSMIYGTWADDRALRPPSEKLAEDRRFECALVAWSRQIDWPLVQSLRARFPDDWAGCLHEAFLPEQYYSVLLWKKSHADAALLDGDARGALRAYEDATRTRPPDAWLLAKLSDVYFLLGDAETERALREELYGRLDVDKD